MQKRIEELVSEIKQALDRLDGLAYQNDERTAAVLLQVAELVDEELERLDS